MFYFEFETEDHEKLCGRIAAKRESIDLMKLKKLLNAISIREASEEEYDAQEED